MAFNDYYKIMGVSKDIPQKELKKAYLKRAKQFHPDLHPDDPKAKAKFQALTEAYDDCQTLKSGVSMINTASSGSRPMLSNMPTSMEGKEENIIIMVVERKGLTLVSLQMALAHSLLSLRTYLVRLAHSLGGGRRMRMLTLTNTMPTLQLI